MRVGWGMWVAIGLAVALAVGCGENVELFVDVKTDLVAGLEFVSIETTLTREGARVGADARGATRADDFVSGVRVAELDGLTTGEYVVDVRLLDADGALVVSRITRLNITGGYALTVVITRNCVGVNCADAAAAACFAGRCVDPTCSPERPESCPAPECTADSQCTVGVACGEPRCIEGACFAEARADRCASGEWCDVTVGCRPLPDATPDGGATDGGVDAGVDAGPVRCDPACRWSCAASPTSCVDAVEVSVGGRHVCVRDEAGGVACWGDNASGQLGDGTTMARRTPARVPGLVAREVSAGENHTCAVRQDLSVVCWGDDGTTTPSAVPVGVPGLAGVEHISAGAGRTCADTMAGPMYCWGDNTNGALGDGTMVPRSAPTMVASVASADVLSANGNNHGCAVVGGGLHCWGANGGGQIGVGDTSPHPSPVVVLPSDVTDVATGSDHSCAIIGGAGMCWGSNSIYELGDGTNMQRLVPAAVVGVGASASEIATGLSGNHVCALEAGGGRVWCWGANGSGQVGNGAISMFVSSGAEVVGLTDATNIGAAADVSCAVRATGGVACWGENVFGQVGDGSTTDRSTATAVTRPSP